VPLLGAPKPAVAEKERPVLDELDRLFIAASPMCFIATSDEHGRCDVSPRGDPPGSFLALDDTTVALGDRPGNRRADSLRNLLANPQIGLLFVVPGRGDTLRLNGRARLVTDPALLDRLVVQGHRPKLAVRVAVRGGLLPLLEGLPALGAVGARDMGSRSAAVACADRQAPGAPGRADRGARAVLRARLRAPHLRRAPLT
jgi:predicted pyridoxine 5'-phosphate oxidase superfamily flavin-nucleotide-binding protein